LKKPLTTSLTHLLWETDGISEFPKVSLLETQLELWDITVSVSFGIFVYR